MNDVERVVAAMREIEVILSEHIEPGHKQDSDKTIGRIFEAMDRQGVQDAVGRLRGDRAKLKLV